MAESNLTVKLNQWIAGELTSEDELVNSIYPQLKKAAISQLKKVSCSAMNPTMLVNELYLKLKDSNNIKVENKSHFLAISARAIRQILIDDIRSLDAKKRGGSVDFVTLYDDQVDDESQDNDSSHIIDWKLLNDSLNELQVIDEESVKLIELKFFAGLNNQEIAHVLKVSVSTVSRNWKFAKSWLFNKLNRSH